MSDSLSCEEAADFILRYLDGELPAATRAAFDEHLELCPPCVHYLKSYETTVRLGRGCAEGSSESLPPALIDGILAALRRAKDERGGD